MSIRKNSKAFAGLGHALGRGDKKSAPPLQLEQVPDNYRMPRVSSQMVGGSGQRAPPYRTVAPDAGVAPVAANSAYVQQAQAQSAALRQQREAHRQQAKQHVGEERRRQEEMQRLAREAEEKRASLEAMDRRTSRGSSSAHVDLDGDDDGADDTDDFAFSAEQPVSRGGGGGGGDWRGKETAESRQQTRDQRPRGRKGGGGGASARPVPGSTKSQMAAAAAARELALPNEQYQPGHAMPQPSSSRREPELKFPLVMRMRDVNLGTWACTTGDDIVEVSWTKLQVKFHPLEKNPSVRTGDKHEDYPALKFRYEHVTKIELDYQRRVIRLRGQGVFGDKVDSNIYSPFGSPEAETSWLTMTFAGSAQEFTDNRGFLLKNVPELKSKVSVFNPSSAYGGAAGRDADRSGFGGQASTRRSSGSRQVAAASGQQSMLDYKGTADPHGALPGPWQGQPPPPSPQNSMAGVREKRKREREAKAAKATDADNPHELSPESPFDRSILPERRRSNRLSAQGVGGTPRPTGDQIHPVLVYPNEDCKDAITLTNDDVWRLGNEEFLNDSLVDYYLKYIVTTLEDSPEGKAKLSRCHFFNSFFYKRLTECMGKSSGRRGGGKSPGSGYESVRRWTKNVDIFTKDFLFVPINESLHWSLAVVCWPGKIKDLTAPLPVKSFDIFDRPDTPPAGAAAAAASDRDLSSLHRVLSSPRSEKRAAAAASDGEADAAAAVIGNENDDYDDAEPAWAQKPGRDTQPAAAKKSERGKKQRLSKGGAGDDRTRYEEGVDLNTPEKEKPGMEGGGPGMDITADDEESDNDGAGDELRPPQLAGTVEGGGGGKSTALASRGQYGKADEMNDEEFEDAMEAGAGGGAIVPYSGSGEGSDSEDDRLGDDGPLGGDDKAAQRQAGDYPGASPAGRPDAEEAAAIAAATAASAAESPRKGGKKRARADPSSFAELPSGAGPPPQIPCILYLDSLNGSKERALNLIRDYLLHEYRAKVLKQPVPSAASPGAGPSAAAAAQPEAEDLDADEGEAGEEGEEAAAAPAPKRRTRVSDKPAAGGGEKEEAKPEPLGEKGWEELQAKFKSVRTANVRVPQQHNHYDCGVYMLKFIDQAANDTETMEGVAIDAMSEGRSELTQTRWSRFFNGAGEKIDGRMIDGLRVSIQETIENSGAHQQQSKKQKKGEGGPSGVKP